jgi:peptidoglycan/LPS O-acetylase OafA/YrhL
VAQAAAVLVFITIIYLGDTYKLSYIVLPFGDVIISLSILFLIFAYVTPSNTPVFKVLNSKVMVHIGVLSYSIYVWQQFFYSWQGVPDAIWRQFPLNIVLIYLVSLASYYLWEKQFLKLKKHYSEKRLQPAS